jgi:hypothetical protein
LSDYYVETQSYGGETNAAYETQRHPQSAEIEDPACPAAFRDFEQGS